MECLKKNFDLIEKDGFALKWSALGKTVVLVI
jgi:hypothetical protein